MNCTCGHPLEHHRWLMTLDYGDALTCKHCDCALRVDPRQAALI